MAGGGSWDRGCWPGRFMPMGLWAAAEFRCIWLGWLLLIPVGNKDRGSGTVRPAQGGCRAQAFPTPKPGGARGRSFHHWLPLAGREGTGGTEARSQETKFWLRSPDTTRCWKDRSSALGCISLMTPVSGNSIPEPPPPCPGPSEAQKSQHNHSCATRSQCPHQLASLGPRPVLAPGPEPCGGGGGGSRGRSGSSSSSEVAMVLMALW